MEHRKDRPRRLLPNAVIVFAGVFAAWLAGGPAAADAVSVGARAGLGLATTAARAWAADAELVYLENDEPLDASGRSPRWGYLFHSATLGRSRAWSVRDGRIVTAENLELRFDAPPLPSGWLDSDAVVTAAEKAASKASRRDDRGRLVTLLLMRGAGSEQDRDATTWTFVYSTSGGSSFHVVVDATTGQVQRTWKS